MNIVDQLAPALRDETELDREAKMRQDVLFTQLRVRTGLPSENIDLSEVDFSLTDDELRAQIARERGLTSEGAAEQIDLDEIVIPSREALRRARRKHERAVAKKRRRGQRRFNMNQRKIRRKVVSRESGSTLVKRRRAERAATEAIARMVLELRAEREQLGHPTADMVTAAQAEAVLREQGHEAILRLDALRAA